MSRWHDAGCLSPQIDVKNGLPECRNCNQSADLSSLVPANTSSSSLIPVDEPSSSMNLWWPRSVSYINQAESEHSLADSSPGAVVSVGETDSDRTATTTIAMSAPSTIYPQSLRPTEIRLAVLSAANSHDFPVHLELEVYELDNCPEYEAVSYLWGGENDDTTLGCPVYVGPFWDVLFQTKNCWDMLRFMRPWRGIRMVWVDAVCINQKDVPERSQQVANMGRVYSGCTRVIVYLGSDIVTPLDGRHPRRHPLRDLESGSAVPNFSGHQQPKLPLNLTSLLERRYFSRIWVIQEVLLPCQALIRIGDIDFWADGLTANQIPHLDISLAAAKWFGHVCRAVQIEKNISRLLEMTSNAEATDPRDRVFGLLGITQAEEDLFPRARDHVLQADYSLSSQNVFIGIFAHCLLNLGQDQILYAARGTKARNGCPSWVPQWESREEWRRIFVSPDFRGEEAVQRVISMALQTLLVPEQYTFEAHLLQNNLGGPAESGNQVCSQVCSQTGALCINVTQCMPIKSQPTRIGKYNQYHIFKILPHGMHPVYIFSMQLLDELDFLGSEQAFVHNSSLYPESLTYLILRPVVGTRNSFQLIGACPQIVIGVVKEKDSKFDILGRHPNQYKSFSLADLHSNLRCTLKAVKELCKMEFEFTGPKDEHWLIRLLFPHAKIVGDLLEPFARLAEAEEMKKPFFHLALEMTLKETCLKLCDGMEGVVVESAYVVFTFEQHAWREHKLWKRCIQPGQSRDIWDFRTEIFERIFDPPKIHHNKGLPVGDWVKVRCRSGKFIQRLSDSNQQLRKPWYDLRALRHVSAHTGESILEMLAREPREEDEYIACPPWSPDPSLPRNLALRSALGIVGRTRTVKIV